MHRLVLAGVEEFRVGPVPQRHSRVADNNTACRLRWYFLCHLFRILSSYHDRMNARLAWASWRRLDLSEASASTSAMDLMCSPSGLVSMLALTACRPLPLGAILPCVVGVLVLLLFGEGGSLS